MRVNDSYKTPFTCHRLNLHKIGIQYEIFIWMAIIPGKYITIMFIITITLLHPQTLYGNITD